MRLERKSGKAGEEHAGVTPVFGEARTEFLRQEEFFAARFKIKRDQDDKELKQHAHFSDGDGGAEKPEHYSGVNRMANVAIRAGANQLVAFFQCDDAAPIGAQVDTGPNGEGTTGSSEQRADPGRA